jgi:hypothetical protein
MAPSNEDDTNGSESDPGQTEAPRPRAPSESKRELSQLWQQALGSIDEIRDAIVRGSQAGRAKIDAQLLIRQRDKLLQQLGAQLLEEVARGHPLPPGCADLTQRIATLDADIERAEAEATRAFKE